MVKKSHRGAPRYKSIGEFLVRDLVTSTKKLRGEKSVKNALNSGW